MLSYKEIETLVGDSKKGNKLSTMELVKHFEPFIFNAVKNVNISGYDTNDLIQVGYSALIVAINRYKVNSNTFCSYAYRAIKNAINYTIRSNVKHNNLSLNNTIDEEETMSILDNIQDKANLEDTYLTKLTNNQLSKVLSNLTYEDKELIKEIYFNKTSVRKYAKKHQISYQKALRRKNRILMELRDKFQGEG